MEWKKPDTKHTRAAATPKFRSSHTPTQRDRGLSYLYSKPWFRHLRPPYSIRQLMLLGVACVIIIVGSYNYHRVSTTQQTSGPKPPTVVDYQTLTPNGKPVSQLGGWRRVSPKKATPVYAYTDAIDGVDISVSQQPLPDKFIEGTDGELAQLAKDFGATQEIKAEGVRVYIGTSAKGPQSVMLIKDGLLILIKSQTKIADKSWEHYAESLR